MGAAHRSAHFASTSTRSRCISNDTSWRLIFLQGRSFGFAAIMPSAILLAPRSAARSGDGGSRFKRGAESEPQEKKHRTAGGTENEPDTEMVQAGAEGNGQRGGGKKRAGKKKLTKAQTENRGLWSLVLKSLLQLQQDQRTLASAVLYVYTVKTDSVEIVKMQEQGRAYTDLSKDQPEHGQGPPHLFVFSALLVSLIERGTAVGQRNLGILQTMQARWKEWELDERFALRLGRYPGGAPAPCSTFI